jgi:hypothetical protein
MYLIFDIKIVELFIKTDCCCFRSLYGGSEKFNWYLDLQILELSLGDYTTSKLILRGTNQMCKHLGVLTEELAYWKVYLMQNGG